MSQNICRSCRYVKARNVAVVLEFLLCVWVGAATAGAEPVGAMPPCSADGQAPAASFGVSELIGMAVGSHPSVLAKRSEASAAEAEKSSARWQYFPTPSLSVGRDQKGVSSSTIAVQQPLWAGGRIDAGMDYANARALSAGRSVSDAQHAVAVSVADSYQAWLLSRGRKEVLQRALIFHEERQASMRRRVASGASAAVESDLVSSRLALTKSDLEASESGVRTALARLSQVLGCKVDADSLASAAPVSEARIAALETLLSEADASFPLLRKHDADIEAAERLVSVKRASLWPTLNLRAENIRSDPAGYSGVAPVNDNRIMLVLQFTPGAGLSATAEADAASARVVALRGTREAARRDLHDRVVTEYENYRGAAARRIELLQNRNASSQVLDSYSRLFVAGKRSWLDVLNAAREVTLAEISVADAETMMTASATKLRLYSGQFAWGASPKTEARP